MFEKKLVKKLIFDEGEIEYKKTINVYIDIVFIM